MEIVMKWMDKIPLPPVRFPIFIPYFELYENGMVRSGNETGYGLGVVGSGTGHS
jgi:hypothetical protein